MIFPGARSVQAGVSLIDDAIDDDGETVMVRISNARVMGAGGTVVRTLPIATATATGTISNTDLMPQAWLARFGRTVADQVMEAVEGRVSGARSPGGTDLRCRAGRPCRPGEDGARTRCLRLRRALSGSRPVPGGGRRGRLGRSDARGMRELAGGNLLALTEGLAVERLRRALGRVRWTRFDGRRASSPSTAMWRARCWARMSCRGAGLRGLQSGIPGPRAATTRRRAMVLWSRRSPVSIPTAATT